MGIGSYQFITRTNPKLFFCPGPGFGLLQFSRMLFGFSGAPSSFQRLINSICGDLSSVTTYLDDLLLHSANLQEHIQHLDTLFQHMSNAGLTFRGSKCHIGLSSITYLRHNLSAIGMSPEPEKVSAVCNWPTPSEPDNLRSFLGLASYYRCYVHKFADIKETPYVWNKSCG